MKTTQDDAILLHLQSGKTITSLEALNLYGCFRLAARIKDLRNQKHNIITETVSHNGKIWAKYHIPRPVQLNLLDCSNSIAC